MKKTAVYRNLNFQLICLINLLGFMMVALVSPAFPSIVKALDVPKESVGLLITAVTIPSIILTPLSGILADKYGRKTVLVPSVIIFGLAGGLCAFAPDFNTLLILRLIQGFGSAAIFNTTLVMISDIFSGNERARAMGINITISYLGYIVYPIIGGALANASWNYTFLPCFLSVPLGIIIIFLLKYEEPRNTQSIREYLSDSLRYIKNIRAIWLFLAAIVTYVVYFGGFLNYFSLFMSDRFDASPVTIGLYISAVGVIIGLTSLQAGFVNRRFSPQAVIAVSFIIYAVSMFIIPPLPGIIWCLLPVLVLGIAHGLNSPSMGLLGSMLTPAEYRAGFLAAFGTMINLGMTIAPLITGMAFTLSGSSLDVTFIITGIIALLIPVMTIAVGKKKISLN